MPSLDDERETYRQFDKTWKSDAEPAYPSAAGYSVEDPDIHGDSEGDDLWTYLMMYRRTGQKGYLDRASAWARYFKEDYRACKGGQYASFCYDRDGFLLDHLYGWGLVAWYEHGGDASALAEAESLLVQAETYWSKRQNGGYPVPGKFSMAYYGLRGPARHLLLAVRVAEATGKRRWLELRDRLLELWLQSPDWDARGMYFLGDWSTDQNLGEGAYARGDRIMGSFQVGVLAEAFAHAFRATGDTRLRERMIAMARFIDRHGLDSTYRYTASTFGIVGGKTWHSYSARDTVEYWDPVYTTSLVNTLAFGYHLTGEESLRKRAFYFWDRGNKGVYGEPVKRAGPDSVIDHFADTRFATSTENFYLDNNKGELQYVWALFARSSPLSVTSRPASRGRAPRATVSRQPGSGRIRIVMPGQGPAAARSASTGSVQVLDWTGRRLAVLAGRPEADGIGGGREYVWQGPAAPGVYFLRMETAAGPHTEPVFLGP